MTDSIGLFVVLASGAVFLRQLFLTRYISKTWNGSQLLLRCAAFGLVLFVAARLMVLLLNFARIGAPLQGLLAVVFPVASPAYSGTLVLMLMLSFGVPRIINWMTGAAQSAMASRSFGDLLHLLLVDTVATGQPIAVALNNNKAYVGLVLSAPSLDPEERFFRLLPTMSGSWEPSTMQLVWTDAFAASIANYAPIEERQLLLRLDAVVAAWRFQPGQGRFERPTS